MNLVPYIGIPYEPNGRSIKALDCWGLVILLYLREFGITLPDYREQYKHSHDWKAVEDTVLGNLGEWTLVEKKEPGDLLVFNILGHPIHTAVYLGDNNFLHCFQNTHSCIERLDSITWARRLVGAYRWQTK